ncbi:PAS domain S-box protein [Methylobacterium sp. J-059]|uniref:PAS domain S-box protein n=1 Tax=Methylobacterium sp. J-059 TaxID=2836643 RepID=UPI001FB92B1E|nr:PAS domain S-box protein [Methylobacterium sp. J-059]MCJ2040113.1 PAS domain S-box protein [Methylobacterium sp. J-059]
MMVATTQMPERRRVGLVPNRLAGRLPQALVATGGLVFLALVWLGLLFHLEQRREGEMLQARRDVLNLSIALAEQVSRLIEGVDQVMRLIEADYADDPETFDFARWSKRATMLAESARQIAIFDANGDLVATRDAVPSALSRTNVADRPYFRSLADNPEAGLYVGRTIRGRLMDTFTFNLARRLTRPDGSFGGVLMVAVDPDYLARRFKALDVGADAVVGLFGRDGYVRIREPAMPGMYERDLSRRLDGQGLFARLSEAPAGTYAVESGLDGRARIFGYRATENLPLVVTVGKSVEVVLAPLVAERRNALAVGAVASAVILLGCLVLLRELERRRRREALLVETHRALGEAETLFRGVFENATDHLFVHAVAADGSFALETLNPSAAALIGHSQEAVRGKTPEEVMPPDMAAIVRADIEGVIRSGEPARRQEERVGGDGTHRFEVILVPLREAGGRRVARVFISVRDITHLRRAEEAIALSEARYRLLADNASDMIVQVGLDGRRIYASPASHALLGLAPLDLVGTRPEDEAHPDDAGALSAMIARLSGGEAETAVATYRLRRGDRSYIWVEGSWRLVRDAAGRPAGFVASVRDVDARHQAEDALRSSEARYRALADTLPQLVWIVRAEDGLAAYVNQRFEAYYGPIGTGLAERLAANHPDDAGRMEAARAAAVRDGRGHEIEGRLRRHDGTYRWHKIVMMPIREAGAIVGWLGTALDIDDIIAARRALEETSDLLRLAQDAAEAGSWDLDLVAGSVLLSPESARLHGLSSTEPLRMPIEAWKALVMPEDRERALADAAEAIASRRSFVMEFRITGGDGVERWLQSIGRAYYDPAGRPVRVIGLNLDATDRKQAELALQAAKTAAEAARLEAERASLAKTDFLAAMSHEIRTPLNAVIGFTDLLARSERLAPDLQRHAELARSSGSALLTVVNDILDFSKVEAGAIDLEQRAFAPAALADNGLSIVRGLASAKGLTVIGRIDPDLPPSLVGDEARLRQILLNLLNNAVKFTRRGSVTLAVRHAGTTPAGETIRFSVSDTGIGIPQAKQHRLFERFSQVDNSVSRDFGGTGLGLAICRRLVELMRGTIGVASDDGEGSTFWFTVTLPRGVDVDAPTAVPAVVASHATGHILLVEDVEINQELARLVLEAAGHTVDVVADGAAAVMAVEDGAFDLVLMDVQMPGMDGITATRMIRRLKGPAANVPVIAMTANVLPAEVRQFREAGMDDHVGKPFDRAVLYAAIARWLPGRDAAPVRRAVNG